MRSANAQMGAHGNGWLRLGRVPLVRAYGLRGLAVAVHTTHAQEPSRRSRWEAAAADSTCTGGMAAVEITAVARSASSKGDAGGSTEPAEAEATSGMAASGYCNGNGGGSDVQQASGTAKMVSPVN